jgi:hypothetical protein
MANWDILLAAYSLRRKIFFNLPIVLAKQEEKDKGEQEI